jgi:hypothetical protein
MKMTGKALVGVLALCATALASAESVNWVAKDTRATLVPGGVQGTAAQPLYVCRATVGAVVAVGKFSTGDRSGQCLVAVEGGEQAVLEYEVLAQASKSEVTYRWVPGHATGYPQQSVIGGRAADGQRTLVCAALNTGDGSVHPGYIANENCVYGLDGKALVSDNYLVLVSDDPEVATTTEAQPAVEGFDPGGILGATGVASLCGLAEGLCEPAPQR